MQDEITYLTNIVSFGIQYDSRTKDNVNWLPLCKVLWCLSETIYLAKRDSRDNITKYFSSKLRLVCFYLPPTLRQPLILSKTKFNLRILLLLDNGKPRDNKEHSWEKYNFCEYLIKQNSTCLISLGWKIYLQYSILHRR